MPGRTKIVATIGPASRAVTLLRRMILAGLDVARLNLSHGTHPEHAQVVARVRALSRELGRPVAILADLCGPKVRIRQIAGGTERFLKRGETVVLGDGKRAGKDDLVLSHPRILRAAEPGHRVLIADGTVSLAPIAKDDHGLRCRVLRGGKIRVGKGTNFPDTSLPIAPITPKDRRDLAFALRQKADYVALSFVRAAGDMKALRRAVGARRVSLIAKIELPEALANLDAILRVSDGVMVARGDLAVETSLPEVPLHQKRILSAAARRGVLTITATQMLESMVEHARPTRAEATDVANAVFDGTDAVMLSEETAIGKYPVEAVRAMAEIAEAAERSPYRRRVSLEPDEKLDSPRDAAARGACLAAEELGADAIAVFTLSGATALSVARIRPTARILALTPDPRTEQALALTWGVDPVRVPICRSADDIVNVGYRLLLRRGLVRPGRRLVLVSGRGPTESSTFLIKIL